MEVTIEIPDSELESLIESQVDDQLTSSGYVTDAEVEDVVTNSLPLDLLASEDLSELERKINALIADSDKAVVDLEERLRKQEKGLRIIAVMLASVGEVIDDILLDHEKHHDQVDDDLAQLTQELKSDYQGAPVPDIAGRDL